MKPTVNVTLAALLVLTGAMAASPREATADQLIYACMNNRSGTIHIVGSASSCANNEVRLVWGSADQVVALQQAVATLQAQVAALHSLTSPNGQYAVDVADGGILLQGPGVSIQLNAGNPASPAPTVTVTGTDVVVVAERTTHITSDQTTQIKSNVNTSILSDGTIHMEAAGVVTIKGALVNIN